MNEIEKAPNELDAWVEKLDKKKVLQQSLALITGALTMDRKDLVLSAGRVIQAFTTRHGLKQILSEVKTLEEKGRIKEDYFDTDQAQSCFQQLFSAFDEEAIDPVKMKAMKAVLLTACTEEELSDRDSIEPQLLMRLLSRLESGEILLLRAALVQHAETPESKAAAAISSSYNDWLNSVLPYSGFKSTGLVEIYDEMLMQHRLFTERTLSDRSGIKRGARGRVTGLGLSLISYLEYYDEKIEVDSQ